MDRLSFLKNTSAISAAIVLKPSIVFGTTANSAVRIGIIGCGNRGTAVISSMSKHTPVNIIAMADLFKDKLDNITPKINELNAAKGFPAVQKAHIFKGADAYKRLLALKELDAVLISSPAYTHPGFVEAAVAAGKHIYCEKPVATDVAGCKRVQQAGEKALGKLSLVIGFQIRHATPYAEMVKRIQRGEIGELINAQLYYLSSAAKIHEYKNVSDDEFRIRNHYQFHALSGGILLDQGIHMLDVCNWALNSNPVHATGSGGRKGRPVIGDAWNNYQVLYQYPNDVNVSFHSTQIGPSFGDVCCRFIGSKGVAEAHYSGGVFINGENKWDSGIARSASELTAQQQASGVFLSSLHDADANKEIAFIDSIINRKYLNEATSGVNSTMTAILGRESAGAGRKMSWEELNRSSQHFDTKLDLSKFD
ncbi:MAG: Gfo/Idh/MocA family oxidoreductase [Chitinophagaceae bacterium]|nr:MAG: Gfo/Idh/MocA family oxidoreductase [Chitinophagaceae bacterium]